jgi:hypothetical protein
MQPDFMATIIQLLHECFEGRPDGQEYTWFVEGKEGIFDALETTSAEKASIKPSPNCASIAAHAYHIRYALRGANAYLGGPPQEGDWESSWAKQTATEPEWDELKRDIYHQYSFFVDYFSKESVDFPDEGTVIGFTAQLPHMAFHLGAIRQIMKIV